MLKRITIMTLMKNKVILGLSGGVDSTAAALLLKEKGYKVTGLYFDIFGSQTNSDEGRKRAETAAQELGIDFIYKDVSCEFEDIVIKNFCSEYMAGRTPNPCIVCNPAIKFKTLTEAADERDAYYIATGHYADTYYESGRWYVRRAYNIKKDQSYMLYRLDQNIISRLILPLNDVEEKEHVRQLARSRSLNNSEAEDSQEICFISEEDNYKDFLKRKGFKTPKGKFTDRYGNMLGEHQGILNYTIGQRKGLGLDHPAADGRPRYVLETRPATNQVVVGPAQLLSRTTVSATDLITLVDDADWEHVSLQLRAHGRAVPAQVKLDTQAATLEAQLQEPVRGIAAGQSLVVYDGERVLAQATVA